MSDLRRYVDKPRLLARDWISAITLSTVGVGASVAFSAGYLHHLTQKSDTNFSDKVKEAYIHRKNLKQFMRREDNKEFRSNLNVTLLTFIASSVASLVYFLGVQKQLRARESAIKLEYVSRVLQERGFTEDIETHTFYREIPEAARQASDDTPKPSAPSLHTPASNIALNDIPQQSELFGTRILESQNTVPEGSKLQIFHY